MKRAWHRDDESIKYIWGKQETSLTNIYARFCQKNKTLDLVYDILFFNKKYLDVLKSFKNNKCISHKESIRSWWREDKIYINGSWDWDPNDIKRPWDPNDESMRSRQREHDIYTKRS